MRRVLLVLLAIVCLVPSVSAQSRFPALENVLVVEVRSSRHGTTQGSYKLTLPSKTRITVSAADVHDAATLYARRVLGTQASHSVNAARVFVLHIQSLTPAGQALVVVTLHSGAVVRLATNDIGDPRLTFLRTALAEANARERADQDRARVEQYRTQRAYLQKTLLDRIRLLDWPQPQGVFGRVTMKFVVHRDGRITDIEVKESGGEVLDLTSKQMLLAIGQISPLPAEFPDDTMPVELVLMYSR
jgi:hypothetical protein